MPSLEALTASMDDRAYAGGSWFLAGVSGNKIYGFTGPAQEAYVTSGDIDVGRSVLTLLKPIVDVGVGQASVSSRVLLNDVPVFNGYLTPDSENRVSVRSNGNYHRIRISPTSGDWKTIVGVDVEYSGQGTR